MLFLQGRNDPFATPNEQLDEVVARVGPTATSSGSRAADHSFEVKGAKRPAAEIAASLAPRGGVPARAPVGAGAAAGYGRGYGTRMILPRRWPVSLCRCASATSVSG